MILKNKIVAKENLKKKHILVGVHKKLLLWSVGNMCFFGCAIAKYIWRVVQIVLNLK
jgi:hypothetical protein